MLSCVCSFSMCFVNVFVFACARCLLWTLFWSLLSFVLRGWIRRKSTRTSEHRLDSIRLVRRLDPFRFTHVLQTDTQSTRACTYTVTHRLEMSWVQATYLVTCLFCDTELLTWQSGHANLETSRCPSQDTLCSCPAVSAPRTIFQVAIHIYIYTYIHIYIYI